jgi:hypothetical protein
MDWFIGHKLRSYPQAHRHLRRLSLVERGGPHVTPPEGFDAISVQEVRVHLEAYKRSSLESTMRPMWCQPSAEDVESIRAEYPRRIHARRAARRDECGDC